MIKMFRARFDQYIRKNFDVDYLTREDLVARLARMIRQINFQKFNDHHVDECMYMINYFMHLKTHMDLKPDSLYDLDIKLWNCFDYTFREMTGYSL